MDDLVKQIAAAEDYEQASEALIELVSIDPDAGARVALKLLDADIGDVYLQGFAFNMLYRVDLPAAVAYIRQNANTCDSYILGEMLAEVASDEALLSESEEVRQAVALLRSAIKARKAGDMEEISGSVDMFYDAYGR